jgi:hypothetical protein
VEIKKCEGSKIFWECGGLSKVFEDYYVSLARPVSDSVPVAAFLKA